MSIEIDAIAFTDNAEYDVTITVAMTSSARGLDINSASTAPNDEEEYEIIDIKAHGEVSDSEMLEIRSSIGEFRGSWSLSNAVKLELKRKASQHDETMH